MPQIQFAEVFIGATEISRTSTFNITVTFPARRAHQDRHRDTSSTHPQRAIPSPPLLPTPLQLRRNLVPLPQNPSQGSWEAPWHEPHLNSHTDVIQGK